MPTAIRNPEILPPEVLHPVLRAVVTRSEHAETLDRMLRRTYQDGVPVEVPMLALGGRNVSLRPATSDSNVVVETFAGLFHLPPVTLAEDAVIVDLGACIGTTAAHFAWTYPNARVLAVEADRENFEMLRRNTAWCQERVHCVHAAAWNEDATVRFGGQEHWSRRVRNIWDLPHPYADPEIGSVPAIGVRSLVESALRRFAPERARVDYVKMDIEGSEAAVFDADVSWLSRVDSIRVHVHQPTTIDRVITRLSSGGMLARRCWKHHRSVVALSPAAAARAQRWPVNSDTLESSPPHI